jgi:hypothetical protein
MPRKFLSFFPQSIAPQPLTSCNATPLLISARPHATMQAGAPPNQTLPIALNIARLTFRLCHDAPPSMLPSHLKATACNSAPALRRPHTCADRTVRIITGQLGKEASMLTGCIDTTDVRRAHGVRPLSGRPWCQKLLNRTMHASCGNLFIPRRLRRQPFFSIEKPHTGANISLVTEVEMLMFSAATGFSMDGGSLLF